VTTTQEPAAAAPGAGVRVARTAAAVSVLAVAGQLLGLLRDTSIARLFGASAQTDAFLVAWTVPETATPLLMEGAMAFVLVPLFARELDRRGSLSEVVARTWLPLLVALTAATALLAWAAPAVVAVLAPGLGEPELAVRCLRTSAATVLLLGTSGYLMAAARVRGSFLLPASVYVAWNVVILGCIWLLRGELGVYSAALGLTLGALAMVVVQLPAFVRATVLRRPRLDLSSLALFLPFVPIAGYTLARQGQTLVERVIGSLLDPGTISQLNYAQKIAQVPVTLAVTAAAITFPALAVTAARGDLPALARAMTRDLRVVVLLVVPATAALVALAPYAVALLFERGAFTAADTAATAGVLRVYALGLLGQAVTSVGVLAAFSGTGRTWRPALLATAGLAATVAVSVPAAAVLGPRGLALGNAVGISLVAVLLVRRLTRDVAPLDLAALGGFVARALLAGSAAGAAGSAVAAGLPAGPPVLPLVLGGTTVLIVFAAVSAALGPAEVSAGATAVRTRTARALTGDVPFVAMYHSVGDPSDDPHVVVVSPQRLEAQLRWLSARGLRGVSLRELYAAQADGSAAGLVGLSFDDGYTDFLQAAVPLLERHGCTATVFMVAGRLEGTNDWDAGPVRPLMSADQLREVARRGHEVASHGLEHRDLRGLPADELAHEVAGSRRLLEAVLGEPVVGFCYPYGAVDEAAREAVARAGYAYGAGVGLPAAWDVRDTPRSFVGEADGGLRLLAKVVLFRWRVRGHRPEVAA
jgi:putative peptidoglycan lipid II flippase